jgi:hypothetical protein
MKLISGTLVAIASLFLATPSFSGPPGGPQTNEVWLFDGTGNAIGSLDGAIDVHQADVHTALISRHLIDFDSSTEAISSVSAGDTVLLVASTTGFVDGDSVVLKDSDGYVREHHFEVIAVVADTSIELDTPVSTDYATGTVEEVILNCAVDGSGATVVYEAGPPADEVWHITRLNISITDETAMDDSEFGGLGSALEYGVVVRENKNSGTYSTLTNWKVNGNMVEDMYDVTYVARTLPAGSYGLRGRWTFEKAGVIVKLDGSTSDKIEVLIQDDLTGLLTFKMKVQGHKEGG